MADRQSTELTAGAELGKYTLITALARGGMARVWLARERGIVGLSRLVVVKVLLPHLAEDDEFRTMFLDEARISAQLEHANVVRIYDVGEELGRYYIAMEMVMGDSLSSIDLALKAAESSMPPPLAARIAADACKALHYVHARKDHQGRSLGIVHRDISPQNIMVTYEGEVKVVDFGIAKAAGRTQHTQTGILKGKSRYMSPEQISTTEIDHRSDIFSMGTVLFELCTGRRLFDGPSDVASLRLVEECRVPSPSNLNPRISPSLERLLLRALARDRDERFSEAGEMQAALEDYLAEEGGCSNEKVGRYLSTLCLEQLQKKASFIESVMKGPSPVELRPLAEPLSNLAEKTGPSIEASGVDSSIVQAVRDGEPPSVRRWLVWVGAGLSVAALGVVIALLVSSRSELVVVSETPQREPEIELASPPAPAPEPESAPAPQDEREVVPEPREERAPAKTARTTPAVKTAPAKTATGNGPLEKSAKQTPAPEKRRGKKPPILE